MGVQCDFCIDFLWISFSWLETAFLFPSESWETALLVYKQGIVSWLKQGTAEAQGWVLSYGWVNST